MTSEQFGKEPTRDELEQDLSRIANATLAEELERKRLGLTLEPEATREKKKEPWKIEPIQSTYPEEYRDVDETGKSDGDVIEEYENAGWQLSETVKNPSATDVKTEDGKEVKVIGRGDHALVFMRAKRTPEEEGISGAD
jgi:hypothetical protein